MPGPEALARALAGRGAPAVPLAEWHAAVASTSDRLKALARAGAPEWTVVLADEQTGGRGREGREWASPRGSLYMSVLLRPRSGAGLLPFAAGLAVADAVAEHGVRAELKWPNDVLVGGRKLAGILSEAASGAAGLDWVAVGIGVNVAPGSLPEPLRGQAATLAEHGTPPALATLAAAVIARLRVWYDALSSPSSVLAAWRGRAVAWWGEAVEVHVGQDVVRGRLLDVDDDGALVLATAGGTTRRVLSGEVVRLRRTG